MVRILYMLAVNIIPCPEMARTKSHRWKWMAFVGEVSRPICQEQKVSVSGFQIMVQKLNLGSLLKF